MATAAYDRFSCRSGLRGRANRISVSVRRPTTEQFHDGEEHSEQDWLSYAFDLKAIAPDDHQVRPIAALLDLTWVRTEMAPHDSRQVCSTASFAELEE